MRASVQFPREKFVSAACSSASSGTVKAKILSSSVCSSGFICTLEVVADGEATHGPQFCGTGSRRLQRTQGHRWGHRGWLGLGMDISSATDLTRPTRACRALLLCVSAPLYGRYWCLQRASAKAPQRNIAPNAAANQAGGPWSGGLLKMLIAPTQSATPMPRQVNRRMYFHTIIAASKALFTCPRR